MQDSRRLKTLLRIFAVAATLWVCVDQDVLWSVSVRDTAPTTTLVKSPASLDHPTVAPGSPPAAVTIPPGLAEKIAEAPGAVLLDFYARWCDPCHLQNSILRDVKDVATQTQTTFIKINVDQHSELVEQMQISMLPTIMLVKEGQIVQQHVGLASKQRLIDWMR